MRKIGKYIPFSKVFLGLFSHFLLDFFMDTSSKRSEKREASGAQPHGKHWVAAGSFGGDESCGLVWLLSHSSPQRPVVFGSLLSHQQAFSTV